MFSKDLIKKLPMPRNLKKYINGFTPYGVVRFNENELDSVYVTIYMDNSFLKRVNIRERVETINGLIKFDLKEKGFKFNSIYVLINGKEYRFDRNLKLLFNYRTTMGEMDEVVLEKTKDNKVVETYTGWMDSKKEEFTSFAEKLKSLKIITPNTDEDFKWGYKNHNHSIIYLFIDAPLKEAGTLKKIF